MKTSRSITLAVVLTLVASFLPLAQSYAQTPAASPNQVVQSLANIGEGSFSGVGPVAPGTGNTSSEFSPRPDLDTAIPRLANRASSIAPNSAAAAEPVVNGLSVTSNNPKGFFGFNGLTHADQRNVGAGVYANTQFSKEPPDQGLCVGNGFVLETINTALAIYSPSGALLAGPLGLNQFFNLAPEVVRSTLVFGPTVGDPRCYFDVSTRRWFLSTFEIDATGIRNHVFLAVSKTSNPAGAWRLYSLDVTDDGLNGTPSHPGCAALGCFGDQPLIGADNYGFYISTNEYPNTGGFNGAQVYAMSKFGLENGFVPAVVHFDNLFFPGDGPAYTIQPATSTTGSDPGHNGTEFFLSALQFLTAYDNRIAIWSLTGSHTLSRQSPSVTLQYSLVHTESYGEPVPAVQKAGPIPLGASQGFPEAFLNTNDDRMNQVIYSRGLLYSGLNTAMLINGNEQSGIAYFVVQSGFKGSSVTGSIAQQGYVGVANEFVFFPSLTPSNNGRSTVMTFSLSGPDYFPSAAYTLFNNGEDKKNGKVFIASAGVAPEDGFTGYPPNGNVARWGDYSAAVSDGNNMWFATEYIPNLTRTVNANWGTFIGRINP